VDLAMKTQYNLRLQALQARFEERRHQVPVLAQRAEDEGIREIRHDEDVVPLLFPHTTYKSYPETLISKGMWPQLNRWLNSLSVHRVDVDMRGVEDVDSWIQRLEEAGHLVTGSSGTSGKASFLNKSFADRQASLADFIQCMTDLGLPPAPAWHVIPTGPETGIRSHLVMRDLLIRSYGREDAIVIPPAMVSTGHYRYMALLAGMRKAMAEGTARPDDVAAFEAEAADRQRANDERLRLLAEQILAYREEPMLFSAMFAMLYRLVEHLRELGASPGDLTAANALTTGGGLKGMALPSDYREQCFSMLNIASDRFLHYYSMQELNVRMPKCPVAGRYHVPEALALFVLDKDGEVLAPVSDGQAEGRAAFFDFTVDGRWGGTMSGDKVIAEFGPCPCGRPGPTVLDDITRFSDLADGDKITCAGTMDAYVRGFIEA
jgi:hypothetical protein